MSEPEKRRLIDNITTVMVGNTTSFSNDFRFNKLDSSASSEVFDQSIKNVNHKIRYLYNQIHKLERVQIAESIMQIETLDGRISRFLIRFDEALLSLEMELDLQELLELNRLREYSLFGIHMTPPNSPFSLFSYCRELNELCSQKDFTFQQHFPYVQTPEVFAKEIAKVHGRLHKSKPAEPLTMCHHCKVLLPTKSFFSCAKKFKRMQTDPCRPLLIQGTSSGSASSAIGSACRRSARDATAWPASTAGTATAPTTRSAVRLVKRCVSAPGATASTTSNDSQPFSRDSEAMCTLSWSKVQRPNCPRRCSLSTGR